jgi:glc operon protein GlcG
MYSNFRISSSQALQLVQYAGQEATRIDKAIAVAVCGPEGELLAFLRMDGASPAASRIAQHKAYTSACDRKSTRAMGEFMRTQNRPQNYWGDEKITGFGGGLPVLDQDRVIGGIGISGLSEEEDERIASEAIRQVFQ